MMTYKGLEKYSLDKWTYENLGDVRNTVENKKQSFILINDGKTGIGKTTLSIQQAFFFAKGDKTKFNQDHVLYDPIESFDKVANSKRGDVWIFDEAVVFNSRSAMTKYNRTMLMLLSTIRSKQIYVILNIPSFFDLDRGITMNLANMLFHLYGDYFGDRGKYLIFDDKRMKTLFLKGKKSYDYYVVKANFFASFGSKFLLDEKEYEKKKKKEVKKLMKTYETNVVSERSKKWIEQRDLCVFRLNKKYEESTKEIGNFLNLDRTTILQILSRVKK